MPAYQPVQAMYTQVVPGQYITPVMANQTQMSNFVPEPVKSADGSLRT